MDTDKKEYYEILYMLDRISDRFNKELNKIKIKLKLDEVRPELRKCSYSFYYDILVPLFEEKEKITLSDIRTKTQMKKSTIQNYLSELWKNKYINKIRNEREDKRTKLYKKIA